MLKLDSLSNSLGKFSLPNSEDTSLDTKKGVVCQLCSGLNWVPTDDKFGEPNFGKMQPCVCKKQDFDQKEIKQNLQSYAGLTKNFSQVNFENKSILPDGRTKWADKFSFRRAFEKVRKHAQEAPEVPDNGGLGLILYGPPRVGKTHLVAALINTRIEQQKPSLFLDCNSLADHLRYDSESSQRNDFLSMATTTPLLVLDDLGESVFNYEWVYSQLEVVLKKRVEEKLTTVITTKLTPESVPGGFYNLFNDEDVFGVCEISSAKSRFSDVYGVSDSELKRMTFDNFNKTGLSESQNELDEMERDLILMAYNEAKEFAKNPTDWLFFCGNTGVGKTHLALAIANEASQNGIRVVYRTAVEMLDQMRPTSSFGGEKIHQVQKKALRPVSYFPVGYFKDAELLVLDNFGEVSASEWSDEKLFQIVEYRYAKRLPTVLVSLGAPISQVYDGGPRFSPIPLNKLLSESSKMYADAIISRLSDEKVVKRCEIRSYDVRKMVGPSRR